MNKRLSFDEWYSLALNYYEHYGNLEIKQNLKTKNGYDYDEDGYDLGVWLKNQKMFFKNGQLKEDRYVKLSKIGFDWFSVKGDKEILCRKVGINYKKYEYLISIISYKELYSKIYYLLDNRYAIVDIKGNINRILLSRLHERINRLSL